MPNPVPVKASIFPFLTRWLPSAAFVWSSLVATDARSQNIEPIAPKKNAPEPAGTPAQRALLKLIRSPEEWRIHQEADTLTAASATVRISLSEHRLRVFNDGALAVDCPVAHGRIAAPSPEGTFSITAKQTIVKGLDYGHILDRAGRVLLRGVFSKLDAIPPGATFDPASPKCAFRLSDDGPLIFAGEATGAATSDGSIVIPDRVASFLFEKIEVGTKVIIER